MARVNFRLPDVGEGVAEAEIVKWHVELGAELREEQPLVDVLTDKATVEIAAPTSGRLVWRGAEEGAKLAVGADLAAFETTGESPQTRLANPQVIAGAAKQSSLAASGDVEALPHPAERIEDLTPMALRVGSVRAKSLAAPAVRARASALGIELASIAPSGDDGRILHADLDAALRSRAPVASAAQPTGASINASQPGDEDVKIFGLRRRIAERMQDATRRIPHFTYVEEVDVTALETLREKLNAARSAGERLTPLPFLIRAIALSLAAHPNINAHFDDVGSLMRRFKRLNIGIATQTALGLLVPVIRNAQALDVAQLAVEIARVSAAARAGKASREELTGSTLTVTSLGALGGVASTPIVNPPEVAILGANRIAERVVVRDGAISVRKIMNLSSSFDHRIIDGYDAAAFVAAVKGRLEAPEGL